MTARSVWGSWLFRDDADRQRYLELIAMVARSCGWQVLTYCLMGNHIHLLVRVPEGNLADAMRRLHGTYAREFNRRHARRGHLFDGRYKARTVQTDHHLIACMRYIARNPVVAELCTDAAEYRWSGHRALLGVDRAPAFLDVEWAFGFTLDDVAGGRVYYARLVAGDGNGITSELATRLEAERIAVLRDAGAPIARIAAEIGVRSVSTVYRRIQRLREEAYPFL